mmetsp:Transcript_47767/g.95627  ORF Transcript_47767/g.95627 Transcript_47767/m.95627 type:complete len:95 (-) Transcript_47767:1-285(-)
MAQFGFVLLNMAFRWSGKERLDWFTLKKELNNSHASSKRQEYPRVPGSLHHSDDSLDRNSENGLLVNVSQNVIDIDFSVSATRGKQSLLEFPVK